MTYPSKKNFCGGNFCDWLEVMLTDKCNGKCSWCVERNGYKPKHHASWDVLAKRILGSGKRHIVLLGGEPTLYKDLGKLIDILAANGLKVFMTTNGSMLSSRYVRENLLHLAGINISIHDYDLQRNEGITGIALSPLTLKMVIEMLHGVDATIRLNCNLIRTHIDNETEIGRYLDFAESLGADSVRFAELKDDAENFVDLYSIYGVRYGINNDPFGLGCNTDVVIDGMPVNFRQMCGLQTEKRKRPVNPQQIVKRVLYYDGEFYNGWQKRRCVEMSDKDILLILIQVAEGKLGIIEAAQALKGLQEVESTEGSVVTTVVAKSREGSGCQY